MQINKSPRKIYEDERGYLSCLFRETDNSLIYNDPLTVPLSKLRFVEDRISYSKAGVLRGFHGDSKTWKLCTCIYGELLLVTYDLRTETKTEHILTSNHTDKHGCVEKILIPPYVLNAHTPITNECILHYKWSEYYDLGTQWTVAWNDPDINANWDGVLEDMGFSSPILSERDANAPTLKEWAAAYEKTGQNIKKYKGGSPVVWWKGWMPFEKGG